MSEIHIEKLVIATNKETCDYALDSKFGFKRKKPTQFLLITCSVQRRFVRYDVEATPLISTT